MGAWGTGIFENDTANDALFEMAGLIDNYYKKLVDSEDENENALAAFLYTCKADENKYNSLKGETPDLDTVIKALDFETIKQYKYKLIGNLYKCLDNVSDWNEDCRNDRRNLITNMIDTIAQGD